MVFLLFLHFLVVTNQDYWEPYFENDKLKISYKTSICNGKNVIVEAEYFVIRIENKTSETYVLNFHKGEHNEYDSEDKIAIILKPFQEIKGGCSNESLELRMFKRTLITNQRKTALNNFKLTNIKVIEVY
ncbi:MAG: hypothetical protein ACJ0PR_05390 [Flavobacteriaceae bacterium]|tara:strand:- start:265 stop:654 length:390 start_codon:yes stop_codon:yes gene_type:complete